MRKRWMAEIFYNDSSGPPDVIAFEELRDRHDIVEMGPNWNTIERIVITPNLSFVLPAPEIQGD